MEMNIIKLLFLSLFFLSALTSNAQEIWRGDFEEENVSDFDSIWLQNGNCNTGTTATVSESAALFGNYGFDIYYEMDDEPRGDCQLHQDNNTSGVVELETSQTHYTFDGYFNLPVNTEDFCRLPITQRKLVYFKSENWDGSPTSPWAFFLKWENSGTWDCATDGGQLIIGYGNGGGTGASLYGESFDDPLHSAIKNNVWYHLRAEVEYGTFGNDRMQIWLGEYGGTFYKILDRNNLSLRGEADQLLGLKTVEVGRQVNLSRYDVDGVWEYPVSEHRYWDNISVHTGEFTDIASPSAPTGLGVL